MSFKSRTSHVDVENVENNEQPMADQLDQKGPFSPLMFDDDPNVEVQSQLNRSSYPLNKVILSRKSTSQWTHNSKIASIRESSEFTMPRSNQMEEVVLSMCHIERVNICQLCDDVACMNETIDYHNRSITDITLNASDDSIVDTKMGSSAKRARLSETSDGAPHISFSCSSNLLETDDIFTNLMDQAEMINDQLTSLHEDW